MRSIIDLPARILFGVIVGLPLLLYVLYLTVIAEERFVSESVITVRQASSDSSGGIPGAALLFAGINPPAREDTLFLREFMHSLGLLRNLDEELDLRGHYSADQSDWPMRLAANASQEDFLRYYRNRVEVSFDDKTALLKVRAQGFDADFAQRLNKLILEKSERFVNETSQLIARERLRFAETELQRAGGQLQKARNEMLAFQAKHKLLDPKLQAQFSGTLTGELEASRSRVEAELNGLLGFLNEDAYQVQALRGRIAALSKQIDAERSRATSDGKHGERLNQLAIDFQGLELQAEFARDAYKLALGAVENARIDATRKIKSLVVVEPPSQPETAEYPHVSYNVATLLAICVLLYAITRLVLATIREHQD